MRDILHTLNSFKAYILGDFIIYLGAKIFAIQMAKSSMLTATLLDFDYFMLSIESLIGCVLRWSIFLILFSLSKKVVSIPTRKAKSFAVVFLTIFLSAFILAFIYREILHMRLEIGLLPIGCIKAYRILRGTNAEMKPTDTDNKDWMSRN